MVGYQFEVTDGEAHSKTGAVDHDCLPDTDVEREASSRGLGQQDFAGMCAVGRLAADDQDSARALKECRCICTTEHVQRMLENFNSIPSALLVAVQSDPDVHQAAFLVFGACCFAMSYRKQLRSYSRHHVVEDLDVDWTLRITQGEELDPDRASVRHHVLQKSFHTVVAKRCGCH